MILTTIKTAAYAVKDFTIQHSPEILLGTSIAAGVGATVAGCIATKKMDAINAKHKEIIDILHNEDDAAKDSPEYKREITKEYGRYGLDIAKTWAPCVGLTLLSGTAALGSFKIVNKRLMMEETAFVGVSKALQRHLSSIVIMSLRIRVLKRISIMQQMVLSRRSRN